MKSYNLCQKFLFIPLILFFSAGKAQISEEGVPLSYDSKIIELLKQIDIPAYTLPTFNNDSLRQISDSLSGVECIGCKKQYWGITVNVNINYKNNAWFDIMPNGDKLWMYKIQSNSAFGLQVFFEKYKLPDGAKLFLYNDDKSMLLGAFTSRNNKINEKLAIQPLKGSSILIEYFEPKEVSFSGVLEISSIVHDFKGLFQQSGPWGASANCELDVVCQLGDGWENEISSVALILIPGSEHNGLTNLCTGALINNINQNGIPYFLTADHCVTPSQVDNWVFLFNYEECDCNISNTNNAPETYSLSGATLLANGTNSDYALLRLDDSPLGNFEVCYSGWSRTSSTPMTEMGVHHPKGDVKKISIDNHAAVVDAQSHSWTDGQGNIVSTTPPNTHWAVNFDQGITEPGSSGSPLFNQNHQIIGQLHGGNCDCSSCISYYGIFSLSWASGSFGQWLDPNNTGASTLNTYCPSNTAPGKHCCFNDLHESNDNASEAYDITDEYNVLFSGDYDYVSLESYICVPRDEDHYTIKLDHRGALQVMLSKLPANYQLEIYKNGNLIDDSRSSGTTAEFAEYIQSNSTFGFNQTIEIVIYGDNSVSSSSQPYRLNLYWAPYPSWFANIIYSFINVAEASGETFNFSVSGNTTICQGQSTQLTANGCSGLSYVWSPSTGLSCTECPNPIASPTSTTTYTVASSGINGNPSNIDCYGLIKVTVQVNPGPIANAGPDFNIQSGGGVTLQGSGGGTYSWSPTGSLSNRSIWNPFATPTVTTTYTLTVTSNNGCTDTDQTTVTVNGGGGGAPANDNPCSPTTLLVGSGCTFTTGTNVGATATSGVASPSGCQASSSSGLCCGNYQGGDIWYKAIMPSSGKLIINTQIQSSVNDLVMGIYTGSCNGTLTQIACNDDRVPGFGSGSNWMPYIYLSSPTYPITAGQTIFIRIWEFDNNVQGTFGICAQDPGGTTSNDPDLTITINNINDDTPNPDDEITVQMTVINNGTVNITSSFSARLVLSSDANLDYSDDDYLSGTSHSISSLNSGASVTFSETGTIPISTPSGNYFIIAEVDKLNDQIDESNENNNIANQAIVVGTISPSGPDLDVFGESVSPSSNLAPGMQISVVCTVENEGLQTASSSRVGYFFSENSSYNPGADIYLGDDGLGILDPDDDTREIANLHIPNVTRTGTHYILFVADYQNAISDIDRSNNDESYSINISTITPARPEYSGHIFQLTFERGPIDQPVQQDSLIPYEELNVWFEVKNTGNLDGAEDFKTRLVLSDDVNIDDRDFLIETETHNGVDLAEPDTSAADQVLDGIDLGPKYIIAQIDFENVTVESNEANNKIVYPVTIIPGPYQLPDISIHFTGVNPYNSSLGDTLTIEGFIVNEGIGPIDRSFNIDFYISEDAVFDGDDIDIDLDGGFSLSPTVAIGDTVYFSAIVYTENVNQIGQYYLIGVADDSKVIAEITKSNNSTSIPIYLDDVSCWYNLEFYNDTISYQNGAYFVRVFTSEDCAFWATESSTWLSVIPTSQDPDIGCCDFLYFPSKNISSYPRTDIITLMNRTFTVLQEGCPIIPVKLGNDTLVYGVFTLTAPVDPTYSFYSWSTGETLNSIIVSTSGQYSITVTNNEGCITSDTIEVNITSNSISISGMIITEDGIPIQDVRITLSGSSNQVAMTDLNGYYNFVAPRGGDYTITPSKHHPLNLNCITAIDLIMMQRHILTMDTLDAPYKIIAGDVNVLAAVSAVDIGITKRVILGTDTVFPSGRSWRFARSNFVFANMLYPFPFDTSVTYQNLKEDTLNQNFTGIRLGDVSGNCDQLNQKLSAAGEVQLIMEDQYALPEDMIIIPLKAKDFDNIAAFQFTLSWNPSHLSFLEVNNKALTAFYGKQKVGEGFLTVLWYDLLGGDTTLADDAVVLELKFKVLGVTGSNSEIKIGSELTPIEAYNDQDQLLNILPTNAVVNIGSITQSIRPEMAGYDLRLDPNPFGRTTDITFIIPSQESVTIDIYDLIGKKVKSIKGKYDAGKHIIEWAGDSNEGSSLSNGIYNVKIQAGKYSKSVKAALSR